MRSWTLLLLVGCAGPPRWEVQYIGMCEWFQQQSDCENRTCIEVSCEHACGAQGGAMTSVEPRLLSEAEEACRSRGFVDRRWEEGECLVDDRVAYDRRFCFVQEFK